MRLLLTLVLCCVTVAAAYSASLSEPNYIDLRISAAYLVTLPDGRRVTIDNVSMGRAITNEMMAQQPKPAPEPKKAEAVDLEEETLRKAEEIRSRRSALEQVSRAACPPVGRATRGVPPCAVDLRAVEPTFMPSPEDVTEAQTLLGPRPEASE